MKKKLFICSNIIVFLSIENLFAIDAITDFKNGLLIPAGDKILKWEIDMDGDSKNELFLTLKSDSQEAKERNDVESWVLYQPIAANGTYQECKGVSGTLGSVSSILPQIDHERCFIGVIDELEKKGIVTIRYNNPREGPSIAIIYAYTIEGDHLKKTELVRYPDSTTPNALFNKYLADNKRTVVIPVEIDP
jgi:hypothetical protein